MTTATGPTPAGLTPSSPGATQNSQAMPAASGPGALFQNLVESLTRGREFAPEQIRRIGDALGSFAAPQQQVLLDSGLRFWPVNGLPPEIEEARPFDAPAAPDFGHYILWARTIRIQNAYFSRHVVRHELAHAWDRLRGQSNLQSFDLLPRPRRRRPMVLESRQAAWSAGTLETAYQSYRDLLIRRFGRNGAVTRRCFEMSFDYGGEAMRGYSFQRNVREFYAEGYAVFHGGGDYQHIKMYAFARALFDTLYSEARALGQPVPNQAQLRREGQRQGLIRR